MCQEPRTYALFLSLFLSHGVASHRVPNSRQDLHPLLQKMAEEIIEGSYLNALLDLIQFQSSHVWTADLSHRVLAYLNSQNVAFTIPSLQAAMENHLEQRLYQPQKLLEDLRETDAQQFRTAMKCLLEDKKERVVRPRGPRGVGAVQGRSVLVALKQTEPGQALTFIYLSPSPQGLWDLDFSHCLQSSKAEACDCYSYGY